MLIEKWQGLADNPGKTRGIICQRKKNREGRKRQASSLAMEKGGEPGSWGLNFPGVRGLGFFRQESVPGKKNPEGRRNRAEVDDSTGGRIRRGRGYEES